MSNEINSEEIVQDTLNVNDTITQQLEYLMETKNGIRTAIQNKGVEVSDSDSFRSYVNKIDNIETNSSEWQPQPDWYDIDKILEEDEEDYAGKWIVLLKDDEDTTYLNQANMFSSIKIKMSDGTEYYNSGNSINFNIYHTWDRTKDKECNLGYKTRYIIFYNNGAINTTASFDNIRYGIYVIFKNITIKNINNDCFSTFPLLECLKMTNCIWTKAGFTIQCRLLEKVVLEDCESNTTNVYEKFLYNNYVLDSKSIQDIYSQVFPETATTLSNAFSYDENLTEIDFMNKTANVTNFGSMFYCCLNLETIRNIDFSSATSVSKTFDYCYSLKNIENISNIKISIGFGYCYGLTHESLLNIINALYDYSEEETSTTHTLTINSMNLAKLTDDEIAVGTDKGWIIK
jgi:hypothetical protein